MAVRQYIGARYVPIYEGDWDATRNYEPLTIVTDANGNSFTSLKDVPAGTSLTDRSYWIQSSSFSAAVDALQRRMGAAEGNISDIQDNINNIQNEITDVRSEISSLSTMKMVLIADSYGMRYSTNWCSLIESRYDAVSDARGGTGFVTNVNFKKQLQDLAATLTQAQREEKTHVIVGGGWNDASLLTSGQTDLGLIQAAIFDFLTESRTLFPNAEVFIGFFAWQSLWSVQIADTSFESLRQVENIYLNSPMPHLHPLSAAKYPMRLVANQDSSFFHPGAQGTLDLFYAICGELAGGHYDYFKSVDVNNGYITGGSPAGGQTSGTVSGVNMRYDVCNDVLRMETGVFNVNLSQAAAQGIEIFSMPEQAFPIPIQSTQMVLDKMWVRASINGAPTKEYTLYGIFERDATNQMIKLIMLAPDGGTIERLVGMAKISTACILRRP